MCVCVCVLACMCCAISSPINEIRMFPSQAADFSINQSVSVYSRDKKAPHAFSISVCASIQGVWPIATDLSISPFDLTNGDDAIARAPIVWSGARR